MFKIYYSRSNGVDDSEIGIHLQDFINRLPADIRRNIVLTRHERGKMYSPAALKEADLVIVGTKNFLNTYQDTTIGKGCFSEIEKAGENDTPVLLLVKDGVTGKVFLQKISSDDVNELDEDDSDTSWENFAEIGHYAEFSDCDTVDEDDIEEDYRNPSGSYSAHTNEPGEIEILLRMLYDSDDIKKFSTVSSTTHSSPSSFSAGRFESQNTDEELLLLLRAR